MSAIQIIRHDQSKEVGMHMQNTLFIAVGGAVLLAAIFCLYCFCREVPSSDSDVIQKGLELSRIEGGMELTVTDEIFSDEMYRSQEGAAATNSTLVE